MLGSLFACSHDGSTGTLCHQYNRVQGTLTSAFWPPAGIPNMKILASGRDVTGSAPPPFAWLSSSRRRGRIAAVVLTRATHAFRKTLNRTQVETCVRRPCMGYGKIQIGSCQYLLAIQTNYTLTYFAEPHREVQPRRRKPLSDRRADQSPVGLGERGGSICNGWSNRQATAIQNRLCAGRVSVCRAPSGCVNLDKEKR